MAQRRRGADDDKLALARAAFPDSAPPDGGATELFRRTCARRRPGGCWPRGSRPAAPGLALLGHGCLVNPVGCNGDGRGGIRLPYCNRCRTWYRTTRSGRIPLATARKLAGMREGTAAAGSGPRYRFLNCESGCGPTGLELMCRVAKEGTAMALNLARSDPTERSPGNVGCRDRGGGGAKG